MKTQQLILLLVIALLAKCAYGQTNLAPANQPTEKDEPALKYRQIFEPSLNIGFKF
jgi:hypothetical protein